MKRPIKKHFKHKRHKGKGVINDIINKLPIELHAPGYHYLGPGTKYEERRHGDFGRTRDKEGRLNSDPVNELDSIAMEHDDAYHHAKDVPTRRIADKKFLEQTRSIYRNPKKKLKERAFAFLSNKLIGLKNRFGSGIKIKIIRKKKS
jgi:hypothetical protein